MISAGEIKPVQPQMPKAATSTEEDRPSSNRDSYVSRLTDDKMLVFDRDMYHEKTLQKKMDTYFSYCEAVETRCTKILKRKFQLGQDNFKNFQKKRKFCMLALNECGHKYEYTFATVLFPDIQILPSWDISVDLFHYREDIEASHFEPKGPFDSPFNRTFIRRSLCDF